MLIAAISSSSTYPQVLNPVAVAKSSSASSATSETSSATISPAATAANAATSSSSSPKSSGGSSGGGGGGGGSAAVEEMQATSFSTTVAGKHYSGSVQDTNGEYVATAAGLAGASASGSSLSSAENNLTTRIDELV